jgi:plasmid replication initiation protein
VDRIHPSSVHILIGQYDPEKLSQVTKYVPPRALCSNVVQKLLRVLTIRVQMNIEVSVYR